MSAERERERERETERDRERQRETERDRDRQTDIQRQTNRQRQRYSERKTKYKDHRNFTTGNLQRNAKASTFLVPFSFLLNITPTWLLFASFNPKDLWRAQNGTLHLFGFNERA